MDGHIKKLAEIKTASNASTAETGGKMELKKGRKSARIA
jgi:hypothetical protein